MSEGFCFKVNTSTYFLLKLIEKYESRSLGQSSVENVCLSADFIFLVLILYKAKVETQMFPAPSSLLHHLKLTLLRIVFAGVLAGFFFSVCGLPTPSKVPSLSNQRLDDFLSLSLQVVHRTQLFCSLYK